ncbi:hypothetical protein BH23ACT9_BH23ACT9_40010 [soil metagenome]
MVEGGIVWGPAAEDLPPPPPLDIDRIITALNDAGVEYLVIGGVAVLAHGNLRTTFDIDVIPRSDVENLRRLADALQGLHARLHGIDPAHVGVDPTDPADLALGGNWVLITDGGRLDIMSAVDGAAPYEQLRARSVPIRSRGFAVVGLDDLIAMKLAANRDKDRADISALTRLHGESPVAPPPTAGLDREVDCGAWMPLARTTCGRRAGHAGRHGRR